MNKLGWIEGKNITVDYRFTERKRERLSELTAELVRLKPDLIVVTSGGPAALAVKGATTTIPIVVTSSVDPVGEGLVTSLARPGGNVTGLSTLAPELNTKRLGILKDTVPKLSRVGILRPSGGGTITADLQLKELRDAASAMSLKLEEIETQPGVKGLEHAFQTAEQNKVNAIMSTVVRGFFAERKRISTLISRAYLRQFLQHTSQCAGSSVSCGGRGQKGTIFVFVISDAENIQTWRTDSFCETSYASRASYAAHVTA
jgi:putative ABC transport system substrate-binding protein